MLLVSNGAFKSGSTWLFNILREMTDYPPPPDEYLNPEWVNPSILPEKLSDFLQNSDYPTTNYLVKNHFDLTHRDMLLSYDHVAVLDIERDVRDVIVSAYYHYQKKGQDVGDFATFYWQSGRRIAESVQLYHAIWNVSSPKVYISSYHRLKNDFVTEVRMIGEFLGMEVSNKTIEALQDKTTIDTLRKRYGQSEQEKGGFFRKGIEGDWVNYFDKSQLRDLEQIQKHGLFYRRRFLVRVGKTMREHAPQCYGFYQTIIRAILYRKRGV